MKARVRVSALSKSKQLIIWLETSPNMTGSTKNLSHQKRGKYHKTKVLLSVIILQIKRKKSRHVLTSQQQYCFWTLVWNKLMSGKAEAK